MIPAAVEVPFAAIETRTGAVEVHSVEMAVSATDEVADKTARETAPALAIEPITALALE
jgi:hypothetical protein